MPFPNEIERGRLLTNYGAAEIPSDVKAMVNRIPKLRKSGKLDYRSPEYKVVMAWWRGTSKQASLAYRERRPIVLRGLS